MLATRAFVLSLVLLSAPLPAASQAAELEAPVPPRSGALGDCTLRITHTQLWRSAILGGPAHGGSHDGFDGLITSVSLEITCASDARLQLSAASVVVSGAAHVLRRPERTTGEHDAPWDGHVQAGLPLEVTITYRGGPCAPRGSEARAVLRFRRPHAGTLELSTPSIAVAFVS